MTDRNGRFEHRMPAFQEHAQVTIIVDGKPFRATAKVAEAEDYKHVVLMWSGKQVLRLHAFEFGARQNQLGHVWSGAPKSPLRAMRGSGGYLTRLGDDTSQSAEVYSFPAAQMSSGGVVRLIVESKVTEENCAKTIHATALQSGALGGLVPTEIELTLPGCDRIGESVRLQNLLQDLRLAAR